MICCHYSTHLTHEKFTQHDCGHLQETDLPAEARIQMENEQRQLIQKVSHLLLLIV